MANKQQRLDRIREARADLEAEAELPPLRGKRPAPSRSSRRTAPRPSGGGPNPHAHLARPSPPRSATSPIPRAGSCWAGTGSSRAITAWPPSMAKVRSSWPGSLHRLLKTDAVDGPCSASCAKLVAVECNELEGAAHHGDYHDRSGHRQARIPAHGADASGKAVLRRKLRRAEVLTFFAAMPPCLVEIEGCSTAHHWAREITALGHQVRLMPASYVKPYVKRGKTDAADAEAICEMVRVRVIATVLAGIAEFERELIQERIRSGIAAAQAWGKRLGRQPGQRPKSDRLAPKVEAGFPERRASARLCRRRRPHWGSTSRAVYCRMKRVFLPSLSRVSPMEAGRPPWVLVRTTTCLRRSPPRTGRPLGIVRRKRVETGS